MNSQVHSRPDFPLSLGFFLQVRTREEHENRVLLVTGFGFQSCTPNGGPLHPPCFASEHRSYWHAKPCSNFLPVNAWPASLKHLITGSLDAPSFWSRFHPVCHMSMFHFSNLPSKPTTSKALYIRAASNCTLPPITQTVSTNLPDADDQARTFQ